MKKPKEKVWMIARRRVDFGSQEEYTERYKNFRSAKREFLWACGIGYYAVVKIVRMKPGPVGVVRSWSIEGGFSR